MCGEEISRRALQSLRYVADMQPNWTRCRNRLHPPGGEVEGAIASPRLDEPAGIPPMAMAFEEPAQNVWN
jgi:hypothetical protein